MVKNDALIKKITTTKNFLALWDFKEPEGQVRKAIGQNEFPLIEIFWTRVVLHEYDNHFSLYRKVNKEKCKPPYIFLCGWYIQHRKVI
jgi:hypothetical protein